jgi:4-hydroxy-2-oxoheptanedioate aldolase
VRAAAYGQRESLAEYVERANAETLDVVFVGPTDLSHSLGVPGQTSHPVVVEAYGAIVEGVQGSAAALGVLVADEAGARAWRERGARYIAVTVDSLVTRSARGLLAAVRE